MGPLEGLKIIEFAGLGPGPFAAMMLADMGADVVRIDRPADQQRKSGAVGALDMGKFDILARNRRLIRLDIRESANRDRVMELIAQADGLIEGFRPGVMERLGLGPDDCLERNARLVYGRMTGWGQEGDAAHLAGHDINYISMNGVLDMIGNKGEKPAAPPTLVGDMGGGAMFLAFGMLAGIINAKRTGEGQVVDAAIIDGSALLSGVVWSIRGAFGWGPHGTNLLDGGPHFYDSYKCADGKYVSVGALEPHFYAEFLDRLGLADGADFKTQMNPADWPGQKAKLALIFASQPRDHWAEIFRDSDGCVWPVLTAEEALLHPHIKERGVYADVDGVTQPAPAPRFEKTPGEIKNLAGGSEDTVDDILKAWTS